MKSSLPRIHNSDSHLSAFEQYPYQQAVTMKPKGLWYGFGTAWLKWCKGNQPDWVKPYLYELEFEPGAKILRLDTDEQILRFTKAHKEKPHPDWTLDDALYLNWPA